MKPTDLAGNKTPTSSRLLNYWGRRIGIALFLLLLLEIILRFLPIGDSSHLVVSVPKSPAQFQVNSKLVDQWVPVGRQVRLPDLFFPAYSWHKPANTKRILCLGDEITQGWPYIGHPAYSSQLRAMLQYMRPTVTWEVINAGVPGFTTARLREIIPDLQRIQPDVICLHFGPGTLLMESERTRERRGVFRFIYYELKQCRLYRLIRKIFRVDASDEGQEYCYLEHYRTYLEYSLDPEKNRPVPNSSPALLANIEQNLRQFLQECQSRQLPVILSLAGVNLLAPPVPETTKSESSRANAAFDSVQKLIQAGLYEQAQPVIQASLGRDSLAAQWHYLNGRLQLELKEFQSALNSFQKARDYEPIPWRRIQPLNQILEQLARGFNLPLVRTDSLFQATAQEFLPGYELFLDAFHPNLEGQYLLAQGFFEKIRNQIPVEFERPLTRSAADSLKNTNLLDQYVGEISIQIFNSGPPFAEKKIQQTVPACRDEILWKLGMRVVRKPELWLITHQAAAHESEQRHQFAAVARHYLAPALYDYSNFAAYHNLGYFYERHGYFLGAAQAYRRSTELNPDNPKLLMKVGSMFVLANQFQTGILFLETALEIYQQRRYLIKNTELILIQLTLAEAYLATQQPAKARQQIQTILATEPNQFHARKLLQQLESTR